MEGGLRDHDGGIFGLCQLLDEHGEAIAFDLITLGLRLDWLGTEALSWWDLLVVVKHLGRTSALAASLVGEAAQWGATEHLLAATLDALNAANWQRAGKKTAPRPKPIPRPGAKSADRRFGKDPIPISEFDDWWEGGDHE